MFLTIQLVPAKNAQMALIQKRASVMICVPLVIQKLTVNALFAPVDLILMVLVSIQPLALLGK
ncbi:hypothetical protein CBP51_00140 [Cellvibrio mixtus]|uniref:Uncharacterized protein n=1 Tax=Cellvibrio mixtus TaxID=39650 RepID=A0A266Q6I8_9GAMM|nr:hypothetical protein CBP51_20390 [Cellvibrio mixtus]OZY83157.1 hypothetical protein CBP51_20435 [Cellvibrio mixtus]OZY85477.1 hypothetical protein CBP51_00030 [Cellvibrio mixtus]OZY85488.1 hypothetical protein CBP51_00085 [Cellvibrio mixtus]OZY85499.1 hypothetical protein CBP51_00140 [Cellvibrio mixtus]